MELHPLLNDPCAVLVVREPVPAEPAWADFEHVGERALGVAGLRLHGENVVFKPNVTSGERFANPDTGITTHPGFIAGMIRYAREHGARRDGFYIVEDPRNSDDNEPRHWKATGYDALAEATGAKLRCPNVYNTVRRTAPRPHVHATRRVSRLAVAPGSVLINAPKLKTHNLGITTLCMKNLMGLDLVFDRHYCAQAWQEMPPQFRDEKRSRHEWMTREIHEQWREGLARRLADLAQVIQPQLNVVEGVVGRDGTGFNRGRNFTLGMAVVGVNMVAVDAITSFIMGFDPLRLVYLKVAAAAGLGCNDARDLRVYTAEDGDMRLCRDINRLRLDPPFEVISGVKEEQLGAVA